MNGDIELSKTDNTINVGIDRKITVKQCIVCGENFNPIQYNHSICSPECQQVRKRQTKRVWSNKNYKSSTKIKNRTNKWREKNKEKNKNNQKNNYYKRIYGITLAEYEELGKSQDWKCAICGENLNEKIRSHLDHDHKTGNIRGILCHLCNVGIGHLRDSVHLLEKALVYLKKDRSDKNGKD